MASKSVSFSSARELRRVQHGLSQLLNTTSASIPYSIRRSYSLSASKTTIPSRNTASSHQFLLSTPTLCAQHRYASQLAKSILPRPGTAAETYVAYGFTQKLFEACSSQADYSIPDASGNRDKIPKNEAGEDIGVGDGWWYKDLGLIPTFSTWSQVTFLHMYLLTVRLRALPSHESVQTYSRHLIDHFSHNAEHRMDVLHGFTSRTLRNKFLKDLFIQWRGVLAAYDEGLAKGDAVLGAAVWRNLWKANHTSPDNQEDIDWTKVAYVVAYMRRSLYELSKVHEADLILSLERHAGKPGIFGITEDDKKLVETGR
ncbi:hypothetical protein ASPZODRAFT_11322 [Penicilliopsis zonata CBS 506.65]|uniref:Ubiquinol-cytochrome c chaperone domain-containing protein n=1 Tax=Penicilliopsis zonata CBS 506.65 TaxID=1073090 RepID=A0A1L9STL2_9EURO|nr:hypothetical protein ASPZODRAFT_11322 [Penicilliopsis zonata CBS 506.65]OJJ50451.1 hypothetical protein ASPZODRAFT_11322 [Penicilliopsis zonata CBS 506.65]